MNCQIRIDGAWEDISIWFTENLADLFEYIAVYEHPAKTTKGVHIHALCMSCRRSNDTIRNLIKRSPDEVIARDASGNKCFALSETAKDGSKRKPVDLNAISYMSRGKWLPVFVKNFEQDVIQEYTKKGYDKDDIIKIQSKITDYTESEEKRKTVYEMQSEVARKIDTMERIDDEVIYDEIEKVMKKYKHRTHMFDMLNWFDNVRFLSSTKSGQFKEEILNKLNSRRRI